MNKINAYNKLIEITSQQIEMLEKDKYPEQVKYRKDMLSHFEDKLNEEYKKWK